MLPCCHCAKQAAGVPSYRSAAYAIAGRAPGKASARLKVAPGDHSILLLRCPESRHRTRLGRSEARWPDGRPASQARRRLNPRLAALDAARRWVVAVAVPVGAGAWWLRLAAGRVRLAAAGSAAVAASSRPRRPRPRPHPTGVAPSRRRTAAATLRISRIARHPERM